MSPEELELQTLLFERRNGVAIITLNRPAQLNAISRRMIAEIHELLDAVAQDDALGAVVLTGAGRAFSSGMDLKDDAAAGPTDVAGWRKTLQEDLDLLLRFWDFEKPTIAAVHGYCLAAACELAMCCDVTIAAEDSYLGEPELKFGSVITAMIMPWLTGPKLAKELILSADDRISAERAERIGLVNTVVPAGKHVDAAYEMARKMAAMDRAAVSMTKEAINRSFEGMGFREALKANLDIAVQLESLETPSRKKFKEITEREGLKAAIAWRDARLASSDKDG
ncbi:MAG: enoyl-CoA hydratase/isomerase family protein [Acidiferrobacterales bacterium]